MPTPPLSPLNLVIDLTWEAEFGTVCGFTEDDLDAVDGLGPYIARAATERWQWTKMLCGNGCGTTTTAIDSICRVTVFRSITRGR